ncbi:MAG: hypothetical protein ACPGUT_03790 [Halocynthiibacter sp.]
MVIRIADGNLEMAMGSSAGQTAPVDGNVTIRELFQTVQVREVDGQDDGCIVQKTGAGSCGKA